MPKLCGKRVKSLSIHTSKKGGGTSTILDKVADTVAQHRVQLAVLHRFTYFFAQPFSTGKLPSPPLGEHIFYPLSTIPITTTTKEKFKER